jgi:hypothetical protein
VMIGSSCCLSWLLPPLCPRTRPRPPHCFLSANVHRTSVRRVAFRPTNTTDAQGAKKAKARPSMLEKRNTSRAVVGAAPMVEPAQRRPS